MSLIDSLLQPALIEDGLRPLRQRARAALQSSGLPGARDEAWRYTSLRMLATRSFALVDSQADRRVPAAAVDARLAAAGLRLVFVNGLLRSDLSALDRLPAGVRVAPHLPAQDTAVGESLAPFVAANLALARSGALIHVDAGVQLDLPLHLFFIVQAGDAPYALHTRVQLVLDEGAHATIIEEHHAESAAAHLCNRVIDIDLGERAQLMHTRTGVGGDALHSLHASRYRLGAGAQVQTFELTTGQALSRHQVDVVLDGNGANFVSGGVQAISGRAHSDMHLSVYHRARDTRCDLVWRGIADQRARLGFTGNLHVEAGADGADTRLQSKNLLLSPHAELNTRPVLVIDADEVKAAHGATVGRLDERALFYLRSRGIAEQRARAMLTHAFAIEAVEVLPEGTPRDAMRWALQQAMAGFVSVDEPGGAIP